LRFHHFIGVLILANWNTNIKFVLIQLWGLPSNFVGVFLEDGANIDGLNLLVDAEWLVQI